jgi:hypothetical protein
MMVAELRQTCQFFELPQNGITPTLQNRLQNYLTAHKHEMQHDYDYMALYPNRDPLPNGNQHDNDSQDSQFFSQWNGIEGRGPAPSEPLQHATSVAATANHRVEEYLQGMSFSLLAFFASLLPHALHALYTSPQFSSIEHHFSSVEHHTP